MSLSFAFVFVLFAAAAATAGVSGHGVHDERTEDWAYSNVRDGAHMFWWLYKCPSPDSSLVIWLQGGPGGSSTGFGNFNEIGPLDSSLKARKQTWLQHSNLLFIDNPVGTGYSYVEDLEYLSVDNDQISKDLLSVLKDFLSKHPEYQKTELWIFSESYGGKMATGFANAIVDAAESGDVHVNFKGVALGDSWISGIDSIWSWSQLLKAVSLIDEHQEEELNSMYSLCQEAMDKGNWDDATQIWGSIENAVIDYADGVDFYNFLLHDEAAYKLFSASPLGYHLLRRQPEALQDLMNGAIRKKLGVIPESVIWGSQAADVFNALNGDFMKPVVEGVDRLLSKGIDVNIYSGQLDLIVATLGTQRWMDRLTWPHLKNFHSAAKHAHSVSGVHTALFSKSYKNLHFYTVMNAGHMIPHDQPKSALLLLELITGGSHSELEAAVE